MSSVWCQREVFWNSVGKTACVCTIGDNTVEQEIFELGDRWGFLEWCLE